MTGKLSKNFHGVGIGPLSKILAVKAVCSKREKGVVHSQQFEAPAVLPKNFHGVGIGPLSKILAVKAVPSLRPCLSS